MTAPSTQQSPKVVDEILLDIARYVARDDVADTAAKDIARICLFDALGCALQALSIPDCTRLLGPLVPGTIVPGGARVPGTGDVLDPVKAAFDLGCLIRWLDFNDSLPTGGHPSDNISPILAVADFVSQKRLASGQSAIRMGEVLSAIVKAYEIHGVISSGNVFDRPGVGLDAVVMVKIASTAVATQLLGGSQQQIVNALSNAFADGQPLNLYRKVPNAGTRKSWAAADATSRAVRFAMMAIDGEMGYPTALSAKTWGFYDVVFREGPLVLPRPFAANAIDNVQFKISYPTQRHGQTAAECAVVLHPLLQGRVDEVERIILRTHERAARTIGVTGPLDTVAARDHCLQYIVAVGLLYGDITGDSYTNTFAADPRIDQLRAQMTLDVDETYTAGYKDRDTWSDANSVQILFKDGSSSPLVERLFPLGHQRRRAEATPLIRDKFEGSLTGPWADRKVALLELFDNRDALENLNVGAFISLLVP